MSKKQIPHELAWEESVSDEPTNQELLEFLGLDDVEIEQALSEETMNIGFTNDIAEYPSRTSKDPSPGEVNKYLTRTYSGGTKQQGTLYNGYVSRCTKSHDGSEYIFKIDEKTIGGAKGSLVDNKYPSLIIDLAGVYHDRVEQARKRAAEASGFIRFGPERFHQLKKFIVETPMLPAPEVLRLEWTDMGIPPVGLKFWNEMWELLPQGHTVFCCVGGHGRTGTALAAMILAASKVTSNEAIELVRKLHCKEAIESTAQERYLEELEKARDSKVRRKGTR